MHLYQERITARPDVMLGKPCVKDTRLTVELILTKLSEGATHAELLEAYPRLTALDILAVLDYAAALVQRKDSPVLSA